MRPEARDKPEKRARFPWIPAADMTEPQRQLAERLTRASSGGTGGPSGLLLRSPATAERLHALIHHLLADSPLPRRLAELAILIQAKLWQQDYEWWAHEHLALRHGLDAAVVAELASGRRPGSMRPDEADVHDFCLALSRDHAVDDALFGRVRATLGEAALADLTVLCGTYVTISMILCVAEARVDPADPLPSPGG
jgi:4-carboxymuconolactone decarboxylase